jgi:poly(glycerol-phosphate) alpha-glucosyltransferase
MLDPWILRRSKIKKKIVGGLIERRLLKSASYAHSLSSSESISISRYESRVSIAQIPNAASDIADQAPYRLARSFFFNNLIRPKTLLFLGRLHEKKGIEPLIGAISKLRGAGTTPTQLVLNIYGWGDPDYVEELTLMISRLGLNDQVFLKGLALGEMKARAFANADAFILPSFSEGLPMAVLEAAASSLPLLITKECNLPQFHKNGAELIQPSITSISDSIRHILFNLSSDQLTNMGEQSRRVFETEFSWEAVAPQYLDLYAKALASK